MFAVLCLNAAALEFKKEDPNKKENILKRYHRWEIFQLGVWYDYPEWTHDSTVKGIKLGFPISSGIGEVQGLEFALFAGTTENIRGVQMSMFGYCRAKELEGVQLGVVNLIDGNLKGAQLGMFNSAEEGDIQLGLINCSEKKGFQLGFINIIKNGWLPFCLLINYSGE